jgi:hypothetical protein
MAKKRFMFVLMLVSVLMLGSMTVRADGDESCLDTPEIRTIFDDINRYRTGLNIAPFQINEDLCTIANEHVIDISTRSNNFQFYRRSDGTTREDWLRAIGYELYSDSIFASGLRIYVTGIHAASANYDPSC